jgi:hypothetical protein
VLLDLLAQIVAQTVHGPEAAAQQASSCFGSEPENRQTRPSEDIGPMHIIQASSQKNEAASHHKIL